MNNSIQIFACDHRNDVQWDLPFIRVGVGFNCNSSIQCVHAGQNIEKYQLPIAEASAIWHVYKHLSDFGNPKYIGCCHYRRFFTTSSKCVCFNVEAQHVDEQLILTPEQQLQILIQNNLDGFTPYPFAENYTLSIDKSDIPNEMHKRAYLQSIEDNVWLDENSYKTAFDNLIKSTPEYLKEHMKKAYTQQLVHFCSIFTMKTSLFYEYASIIWPAFFNTLIEIGQDKMIHANCRSCGYIFERMSSCILWAFKFSGRKLANMPLIVTHSTINPSYRRMTAEQAGMACDIDGFKREIYDKEIHNFMLYNKQI